MPGQVDPRYAWDLYEAQCRWDRLDPDDALGRMAIMHEIAFELRPDVWERREHGTLLTGIGEGDA